MPSNPHNIILASTSKGRAKVCKDAGLVLTDCVDAGVDEAKVKKAMASENSKHIALELSKRKAIAISEEKPDSYVIGADQTLSLSGQKFDKPNTSQGVKNHITAFSGKTHILHSGICVAKGGAVLWADVFDARMQMRPLSDTFINAYVSACGDRVASCVGGYHFEGLGAQLFEKIEGDYFTILGLPLLPLLSFLREQGVIIK